MSLILRLDSRSHAILTQLLAATNYQTIADLVRTTKQSRRTVYYDICKINDWLEMQQLPRIEAERQRGIFIPSAQRELIEAVLQDSTGETPGYIYTPLERVRLIICLVIRSDIPVYIETMASFCGVSRNTVVSDLKTVTAKLQKYDLELNYENKKGYTVTGDTIRKRALFLFYFNYLSPLFESGIPKHFNREVLTQYHYTLLELERALGAKYVSGTLLALTMLLPTMHAGTEPLALRDVEQSEIETTREFKLVGEYFPGLTHGEQCYLALHLLGSRLQSVPIKLLRPDQDNTVYDMAVQLVQEFERIACVELEGKKALERALFAHLKTSLYRYRYGIQLGNPFAEDIIREYPNLFRITRSAARYLEKKIGLPILDGEVAYLTMHFGGFLRSANKQNRRLRILIVCPNGVSTGNMLRGEILTLLPNARIVAVVASADIINVQQVCDLVVSTVAVKSTLPVIVVHPILTNEDRMTILQRGMQGKLSDSGDFMELEPLFTLVSKYVPAENQAELREELAQYLQNRKMGIKSGIPQVHTVGLAELLTEDRVEIFDEQMVWREAVQAACGALLEKQSITQRYVDHILLSLEVYGPYMFLSPGLMLAHAKPTDGTNRLDISVAIFRQTVEFGEDHFAKVLFVLSPVDGERHLDILKDIIAIFSVQQRVEELAACETAGEALTFIKERLASFIDE
ncbi:MAG: BglG family transcription antiterminator [Angelakisella sp.]